ncbi:MAG TPA: sigma-70 region 4 domain-containing protein, partial [Candidatus Limnocylindrales bacterium]
VYIALRRLPTRERQAFIHREFHDWTSQRIADELETKPSNVDVLVCRARAAFGRAYAEVADLPFACRQATETIYRELGSGASEHGLQLMKAHLMVCPRCHAERQRAHSPRFVGAFFPWLWLGTQTRALAQIGERIKTSVVTAGTRVNRAILPSWPGPAKAAAAVVIAATATALVPGVTHYVATKPTIRSASAAAPRSAALSSSSAWGTGSSTSHSVDGGMYGGDAAHDMAALHAAHDGMASGHDAAHDAVAEAHDTRSSGSGSTMTQHSSDGAGTGAVHATDPAGETHTDSGDTTEHATEPHMSDSGDPAP